MPQAFVRRAIVRYGAAALSVASAFVVVGCTRSAAPSPDAGPPATSSAPLASAPASDARAPGPPITLPPAIGLLAAEDPKQTLREGFFIYGFSRDSKLAFVETRIEDGKGETSFRLVIHDLRDDVLVEDLAWSAPQVLDATTLDAFLAARGDAVRALLEKHAIEANGEILDASFQHKDATVRVVLAGADDKITDGEKVRAVVLTKQPGDLEKKVGTVLEKGIAGMPVLYGSRPLAVMRSPFEPRVAILIVTTVRGFEGPPNGRQVTVLGADLERGFVR